MAVRIVSTAMAVAVFDSRREPSLRILTYELLLGAAITTHRYAREHAPTMLRYVFVLTQRFLHRYLRPLMSPHRRLEDNVALAHCRSQPHLHALRISPVLQFLHTVSSWPPSIRLASTVRASYSFGSMLHHPALSLFGTSCPFWPQPLCN